MSEEWQGKPALFCLSGKLGQVSFAWVQMSLVTVQESGGLPQLLPWSASTHQHAQSGSGLQAWPERQKGSWGGNAGQAMSIGWCITLSIQRYHLEPSLGPAGSALPFAAITLLPRDPCCSFLHPSKLTPNWGLPTASLLPGKLLPVLFAWLPDPLPSFLYKAANLPPLRLLLLTLLYFVHST